MFRELATQLAGPSLLERLSREGIDPVGAARTSYGSASDDAAPADGHATRAMVEILLAELVRTTRHLRDAAHRDSETFPAATQLLQVLTQNVNAGPVEWLLALTTLRLSLAQNPNDAVLMFLDADNFNVVLLEGLHRAALARVASHTTR